MAYANRGDQTDRALNILRDGVTHRMKDLMVEGVWPETMTRLVQEGLALRPAQGYYKINPARPSAPDRVWRPHDGGQDRMPYSDSAARDDQSPPRK